MSRQFEAFREDQRNGWPPRARRPHGTPAAVTAAGHRNTRVEPAPIEHLIASLEPDRGLLTRGTWTSASAGTFAIVNPANGQTIADVADGSAQDARAAVDAASAAGASWAATSTRHRSEALMRCFVLMLEHQHELAMLITAENGKPLADAWSEVTYSAEFFRWYAEEVVRPHGDFGPSPAGGTRTVVTHRPVGIAALVTPWNFPAAMAARKIAPALAAGCTVVLKPAAETPLTALAMARLVDQAGVPAGVLNVVPTSRPGDVVATWLEDSRVRALSFTGSTDVGRLLLRQSAEHVLRTSMELGGNAPFVVFPDADIDAAVEGAMMAKFRGGGQACTAANRFYVHESVAEAFTGAFARRVDDLRVGPGHEPGTTIGPLISAGAVAKTAELIDDALRRGARVVTRARVPADLTGHFVAPTVLANVPDDARVVQEEIFGPVAPIVTWSDVDEMVAMANGTEMGLASYIYSRDLLTAMQTAERIEAGMVGINRGLVSDTSAPFGGMKQSGLGREGARDGLAEYMETQYLSVDWK